MLDDPTLGTLIGRNNKLEIAFENDI